MIKSKMLAIFDTMTDNTLEYMGDSSELRELCNALTLDLQLARENKYERKVIYEA